MPAHRAVRARRVTRDRLRAAPAGATLSTSHICFVDESGDEGHSRGTRWFVIAGVVSRTTDTATIDAAVTTAKTDIRSSAEQVLHFRHLNQSNRRHVSSILGGVNTATVIAVASDTYAIPAPTGARLYRPRNWLYHYMCRYLLERVVRVVQEQGGAGVEVVMSNKTTLRYAQLKEYLRRLQQDDAALKMVGDLKPRQPTQSLGVQLADVAASSVFFAFEPDRFGRRDESYIKEIAPRLYRPGGVLVGNGIKLMGNAAATASYLAGDCSWLRTL